jgi:hypothetical protein
MLQVPVQPIASQIVKTILDDQNVQIFLYQKDQGLFCDVNADGTDIVTGVLCMDGVPIVCNAEYMGFSGNLMFVDTQGSEDPSYSNLGTRFVLMYLEASDYAAILSES